MVPVVVGAEDGPVLSLDDAPDPARRGPGGGHSGPAHDSRGQARPSAQVFPGVTAVGGPPQPAFRAAAVEPPGQPAPLPQGRVEDPRVARVKTEVGRPRVLAAMQDQLPAGAAVTGAVDAALRIRAVGVAERGDIGDVGVGRVDAQAGNMASRCQAQVVPGQPAVHRPVDAIA